MSPSLHEAADLSVGEADRLETVVEEISLSIGDPHKLKSSKPLTSEKNTAKPQDSKNSDKWTSSTPRGDWLNRLQQSFLDNYVLLLMSASFGAAINGMCTKVVAAEMSVFQLTLIRGFFCTLVALCMCGWNKISLFQPRSKVRWYLMRGITGSGALLFLVFAICKLQLSEAAFLTNSYPAVTAAVSWLLGMEQLGVLTWVGVAGCLVGNALVAHPPFLFGGHSDWGPDRLFGIGSAVGVNLLQAMMVLVTRHMGKDASPTVMTAYMHMFSFLLPIPFVVAGYPVGLTLRMSWLGWFCLAASCIGGVPIQIVLSRGMQIGPPSKTTSLFMTNMFIMALLGTALLHEQLSWVGIIGAAIVLSSVILITAQNTKPKHAYEQIQSADSREEVELTVHDMT